MNIYTLGLMSGTSMDGVDAVVIELGKSTDRLITAEYFPYPSSLRKKLFLALRERRLKLEDLLDLDASVGNHFAKAAIASQKKSRKKILVIGSHGQTILHRPEKKNSLQIGLASRIATATGITTVSNFRATDLSLGGQGAPLLPYYHRRLLGKSATGKAIHNLGGISNFTYFGPKKTILAMDTGPANCLMDMSMQYGKKNCSYDPEGSHASKGRVREKLLHYLKEKKEVLSYRKKKPPKSTGRELFSYSLWKEFHRRAKKEKLSLEDELATLQQFSTDLAVEAYMRFVLKKGLPLKHILVSGGGAKNRDSLHRMQIALPGVKVKSIAEHGVSPSQVEAQAFAFYAFLSLLGEPFQLPSITGAREKAPSGEITPGKNWKELWRKINKKQKFVSLKPQRNEDKRKSIFA